MQELRNFLKIGKDILIDKYEIINTVNAGAIHESPLR